MRTKDYEKKYCEGLAELSSLFDEVNEIICLHEYIVGEFNYPSLVLLRDMADVYFLTFANNGEVDEGLEKALLKLNKAGLEVLYSMLEKVFNTVNRTYAWYHFGFRTNARLKKYFGSSNENIATFKEAKAFLKEHKLKEKKFLYVFRSSSREFLNSEGRFDGLCYKTEYAKYQAMFRIYDRIKSNGRLLRKGELFDIFRVFSSFFFNKIVFKIIVAIVVFILSLYGLNESYFEKAVEKFSTKNESLKEFPQESDSLHVDF